MATLFRPIKAGSTDVSIVLTILDSTTGLKKTDVVYNSSGMALSYRRDGATTTAITEATLANAGSAHSDGGFVHIGDGEYRLDLPDAACATGVNGVLVHGAVTGGVIQSIYIPLVLVDFSATVTSIPELGIIDIGTLQSATASGAVIRSGATFANDLVIGSTLLATGGTGYGQARIVYDNALTGDSLSISPDFVTTLDNTTTYVLMASPPAPTNSAVLPSVSLGAVGGDTQSMTDLKDLVDTGYNPATHKLAGVVLADTVTTLTGHTPQTGDSYARIGAPVGASISADVAAVKTDTAATLVDTNELQTDWANGGRLDLLIDSIIALLDNARAEPGQGAPPVNPDVVTKIDYLYKAWRNRSTQTATTYSLYADDGTTVDQKSTVSDDGTTYVRGEVATGP